MNGHMRFQITLTPAYFDFMGELAAGALIAGETAASGLPLGFAVVAAGEF